MDQKLLSLLVAAAQDMQMLQLCSCMQCTMHRTAFTAADVAVRPWQVKAGGTTRPGHRPAMSLTLLLPASESWFARPSADGAATPIACDMDLLNMAPPVKEICLPDACERSGPCSTSSQAS